LDFFYLHFISFPDFSRAQRNFLQENTAASLRALRESSTILLNGNGSKKTQKVRAAVGRSLVSFTRIMDTILYDALKLIHKHGKLPAIMLADRLEVKIGLIELKYIDQRPAGFYRLNRLGKSAFRKERWNRILKWWVKNYIRILSVLAILALLFVLLKFVCSRI
jgi:hypothetical protein